MEGSESWKGDEFKYADFEGGSGVVAHQSLNI